MAPLWREACSRKCLRRSSSRSIGRGGRCTFVPARGGRPRIDCRRPCPWTTWRSSSGGRVPASRCSGVASRWRPRPSSKGIWRVRRSWSTRPTGATRPCSPCAEPSQSGSSCTCSPWSTSRPRAPRPYGCTRTTRTSSSCRSGARSSGSSETRPRSCPTPRRCWARMRPLLRSWSASPSWNSPSSPTTCSTSPAASCTRRPRATSPPCTSP
mmetsp:Transcript_4328/g.12270  ORF Transcript_4328/g.12270 Transcript_4328/m.12270 type:complete len:211 (+) Transcript_4328:93-725(+)